MRELVIILGAAALGLCGCSDGQAAPDVVPKGQAEAAPVARKGVKPHYVKCDPARPELPCTPEPVMEAPVEVRGVKPHSVKCDPARPELPCTPEPEVRRPGVKPHYVKCDPARPELPCTPEPPLTLGPPLTGDEVSALGADRPAEAVRGCTTDADCVLSCRRDGDCCPALCRCDHAYNTGFHAELVQHQARCIARGCAKARCADPGYELVPVCEAGICGAREVPRAE